MQPQEYNFKTQRAGDTFSGVQMTCTRISNQIETPIDLTNVEIKMQVKLEACLDPIIDISVGSGITLTDAANGVLKIDAFLVPQIKSFNCVYDLQFTYSSGVVQTYLKGNFPITSDITD